MKISPKTPVLFSLLIFFLIIVSAKAQDEYAATTAENPEVETAILEHMLLPLTKAELEVEAAAWIDLLKTKVTEISQVRIQRASAEGDAAADFATQETQLGAERTRLAERTEIVLEEFSEKGGDAEEFATYADAVTTIGISAEDVQDVGYLATLFTEWLKSPEGGIKWGIGIVAFIVTLIIAKIIAVLVAGLVRRAVEKTQKNSSAVFRNFIVTIAETLVLFVGVVFGL
jgi:small conductance mechanosensitive channel